MAHVWKSMLKPHGGPWRPHQRNPNSPSVITSRDLRILLESSRNVAEVIDLLEKYERTMHPSHVPCGLRSVCRLTSRAVREANTVLHPEQRRLLDRLIRQHCRSFSSVEVEDVLAALLAMETVITRDTVDALRSAVDGLRQEVGEDEAGRMNESLSMISRC